MFAAQVPAVPDAAQPVWLVVVLAVLGLVGTLGVAYLASRAAKSTPPEVGEQGTLSTGGRADPTAAVLQSALDHLARVADRDAAESEDARRETAVLRQRLEAVASELQEVRARAQRAEADLAACRAHADLLSRQAFRRGSDG